MTSILPRDDPEAIKELIRSEQDRASLRITAHETTRQLMLNQHSISLPEGAEENATEVRNGIARQQIDLLRGILAQRPTVTIDALEPTATARKTAQEAENAYRELWPLLELQMGGMPIQSSLIENALCYGLGVERLDYLPFRASTKAGMPAKQGPEQDAWLKQQGLVTGHLPFWWSSVNPWNFFFREDPDAGGLSLAIERRRRFVKELLENPRYEGTLTPLRNWVLTQVGKDYVKALNTVLDFWIVEDSSLCTYFVTMPMESGALDSRTMYSLTAALGTGVIALQMDNPIGRPRYLLTKGLQSSDDDPRWQFYGMLEFSRSLIETLDTLDTATLSHYKDFVYSPIVRTAQLAVTNGVATDLTSTPAGERKPLKLDRSGQTILDLDPGEEVKFLQPNPLSPDFWRQRDSILQQIYLHGISPSLVEADPQMAGYLHESVVNMVLAKFEGVMSGVKLSAAQRVLLAHDLLGHYKTKLYVQNPNKKDKKGNTAAFFELDPDAFASFTFSISADFEVRKRTQTTADLQNSMLAQQVGYSFRDAAQKFLGEEDPDKVQLNKLAQDVVNQPQVKARILEVASRKMNLLLDQQAAQQQGNVDPSQLAKVDPALLQALGQATPPGAPGSSQVQQAMQQAGVQPGQAPQPVPVPSVAPSVVPPAVQPGAPQANAVTRRQGGRAPGQARQPGGPRLGGGTPPMGG